MPRAICVVWVLAAVLATGHTSAESASSPDKAVAEGLFQDGRKLMEKGELARACPKFAESHRLVPRLGTLLNLATCHEKLGKTASAWAEFTEAIALAKRDKRKDREKYARQHADALEKKLSRLVFELEKPAERTVLRLDGEEIGSAVWGTPLPIDPGSHEVEVSAPGRQSWSKSIDVSAGSQTLNLKVPELTEQAAEPQAEAAPERAPEKRPDVPPAADTEPNGSGQRTLGFVALGVGVVGLGVGSYFGLQTFSKQNESEDHCDGTACDQTGVDLRDEAKTTATISTIGFAAGAVGIGAGIVLLITAGGDSERTGRPLWIAPGLGSVTVGGTL
jgi:Tfp pilus assembly protein PilF